jgi:hypothetical protein
MHSDETFERFLEKTDASTGGAVRRAIEAAALDVAAAKAEAIADAAAKAEAEGGAAASAADSRSAAQHPSATEPPSSLPKHALRSLAQLCEVDSRVSFTLPLHIPRQGKGGLRFLDFRRTAEADCGGGTGGRGQQRGASPPSSATSSPAFADCGEAALEAYEVGTLYVHNATLLHQIAPWPYHGVGDGPRITMQGFGFNCGGVWYLYW